MSESKKVATPVCVVSVYELNQRLSNAIAIAPDVQGIWVVGETSDVRISGGHCYFELVEKEESGKIKSRIRATIWANRVKWINNKFRAVTNSDLASNMEVKVYASASYHPAYGMAVNITDIDPNHSVGEAQRRRNEILARLKNEGIIDLNKTIEWPHAPLRVAVVSARGAAGFGDFVNHLFTHPSRFRFHVELFEAVMQGENTVPTVLEALRKIYTRRGDFDGVIIIRGGGATTDLAAFDNYDLAAAVAKMPLPVMVGIGHERDVTVLDDVANMRVKTPTAAAAWLIERISRLMEALGRAADKIYRLASQQIADNRELLARAAASLPGMVQRQIITRRNELERCTMNIGSTVMTVVNKRSQDLDRFSADIRSATLRNVERAHDRLERGEALLKVLSPEAVLARGFTLTTLADGHVLRNMQQAPTGTRIKTYLADGNIISTVD